MFKLSTLTKNNLVAVSNIDKYSFKENAIINPPRHFDFYVVFSKPYCNLLTDTIYYLDVDVVNGNNVYSINTMDKEGYLTGYVSFNTIKEVKEHIKTLRL